MLYRTEGNYLILKLDQGDDVLGTLNEVIEKEKISNGFVVSGIGAAEKIEIGYLREKAYIKQSFSEPMEITSINGSISQDQPRLHIHVNCAGFDHKTMGGHLFNGVAKPLLEILIIRFDNIKMTRELSEKSGLKELKFL
jgi:predicted DNA-binding protein with PD1-like motif